MITRGTPFRLILPALLVLVSGACDDPAGPPQVEPQEHLLFLSTRDGALDDLGRPMRDIYRMAADGSGTVNLTQDPEFNYVHMSRSPDGRRVAFASRCRVWAMGAAGSGLETLAGGTEAEGCNSSPRWSPDGSRIAFASNREQREVGSTRGVEDVYVMNADGSGARNVSHSLGEDLGAHVDMLGWSPGGEVVFETSGVPDDPHTRYVYVVAPDGTGMRPLFDQAGDHSPAWSPDGSRIAFISERDGRARLYVMNADGTGARPLTDHAGDDRLPGRCCGLSAMQFDIDPWSPDGERLAFERFAGAIDWGTIHVVRADGTGLRKLVHFSASFDGWSPSGELIALTRYDPPEPRDIFVVHPDGTGLRNLTNSQSEDTDAFWVEF